MAPFGETVLSWRLVRGLTQAALAAAARMSRPNLSAVERGDREVTLATLRRLAVALGVRPGILADGALSGEPESTRLSRAALERVAAAALAETTPGPRANTIRRARAPTISAPFTAPTPAEACEADLARRLRAVTSARFHPTQLGPRRAADRNLLLLRGLAGPEALASLFDRMRDRSARPKPSRRRVISDGDGT